MDPDLNKSPQNSGSVSAAEALADLNEQIAKESAPISPEYQDLPEGFANLSNDLKNEYLKGSALGLGIQEKPTFQYVKVPYYLRYKIRAAQIGVEVVDTLINPTVYDDKEKMLRIRKDADLDQVVNYIEDTVLSSIENNGNEKELKPEPEIANEQPVEAIGTEKEVNEAPTNPPNQTQETEVPEPKSEMEEQTENFDADKIVPLAQEDKTEDVSDILNQPKLETVPAENTERVAYWKPPEGQFPDWFKEEREKEGSEWKELERLRFDLVRAEDQNNTSSIGDALKLEELRAEYGAKKQKLANVLRERLTGVVAGPLNQEQQKIFDDVVFDELVIKENEAYLTTLEESRSETWKDKAKEALRTVAGLKAVSWYLKQDKWTRAAINTGLFGVAVGVGTFVGGGAAMTAMGATAFRGVRAAGSILGSGSGIAIDKKKYKQIEQVDEEEKTKIEEIKNNPNLSLEEKSKQYTEARESFDKERRWIAKRKAMFMVGGGFLGGSAMGGIFNLAYSGTGGSSALETEKRGGFDQNRTHRGISKFSQEPASPKSDATSTMDQSVKLPTSQDLVAVKPEVKAEIQGLNKSQVDSAQPEAAAAPAADEPAPAPSEAEATVPAPKTSAPESISPLKPETLVHEVKAGDSVWKMLKETLENNDKFKNLSGAGSPQEIADQIEAKQTRVLQSLVDEVLKNNAKYGIGSNGEISIGQKVDFSNLFADSKKLETLLNEAENLKPAQVTSIIDSNHKIETWLSKNPGKQLNLDEIVNQKPKVFEMPKIEPAAPELPEAPEINPSPVSGSEEIEKLKSLSPEMPFQDVEEPKPQLEPERVRLKLAQNEVVDPQARFEASEEVVKAKRELGILEDGRERLRTMSSDTSVVAKTAEINEAVNQVFNNEIDNIYGESHLLGLQKIAGVATKEWKTISGLPARRVLEYFKSPETSDLPQTILQELQTSEKHRKLVEWVADLVEEAHKHSNADFKPYDNGENMESYIKRIGGFLMRQQSQPPVLDKKLA